MTSAVTAYLIDTNVLVYSYDATEVWKRDLATEILDRLATSRTGALSLQVLGEFYNSATRKLKPPLTPQQGWESLMRFSRSWRILEAPLPVVLDAARAAGHYRMSYWDALIWATARHHGVPNVLTEDLQSQPVIEGVRIINPFARDFDRARL